MAPGKLHSAGLPSRYVSLLTPTFGYVGRYARWKPVSNRLAVDSNVKAFFASDAGKGIKPDLSEYGVPELDHDAVVRNLSKYNGPRVDLSPEDAVYLDLARAAVVRMLLPVKARTRIMSYDEVLAEIDLSKSPGFPWNAKYGTHRAVIEKHDSWLREFSEKFFGGVKTDCVWNAFPKEELRTSEKIAQGKVRHISGCPTEWKIAINQLLLAQNNAFYDQHLRSWSCVGINIMSGGWDKLATKLSAHADGLEADIKAQDANYQRFVARVVEQIRFELFPEELQTETTRGLLRTVYDNVFRGYQVTGEGYVFSKEHGNASGSPCTVVDNTIATMLGVAFSYIRRCAELGVDYDEQQMLDKVIAAIYGDDNTLTVAEEVKHLMNHDSLGAGFRALGWELEFAHSGWRPWKDLNFLSRSFYQLADGTYVPKPVDGNKYVHSLFYKGKKHATLLDSFTRANGLYIAAFYDPEARSTIGRFRDWAFDRLQAFGGEDAKLARSQYMTASEVDALYRGRGPHTLRVDEDFLCARVTFGDW